MPDFCHQCSSEPRYPMIFSWSSPMVQSFWCILVPHVGNLSTNHKIQRLVAGAWSMWPKKKVTKSWWFWSIKISIFKTRWFQVAWFKLSEKEVKRCWAAAVMCNDKQRIELLNYIYIHQHPQFNEHQPHHYLQPPTQCQFCLESTNVRSSCDEQPAVMRILVSTQHLHSLDTSTLVQPSRLEKKDAGLPQVSACQNAFKPEGNHSRPAGAECWLMTSYNPTLPLSHPLASLLHSTSFCAFFRYQHFWFNQTVWKEGRGSILSSPSQCVSKSFLSPKATIHRCWLVASYNPA